MLSRVLDYYDPNLSLVFCNTKRKVDELTNELQGRGYFAEGLHGDMKQSQRDRVMNNFRKGKTDILVATDVAARGIDVDDVEAVFNYDIPQDDEYYVHRIGRTARANNDGVALTFISEKEQSNFKSIENFLEKEIYKIPIPEELGEAPEYKPRSFSKGKGGNYKRKDFRRKRNNNNGGKRNNRPSPPRQN